MPHARTWTSTCCGPGALGAGADAFSTIGVAEGPYTTARMLAGTAMWGKHVAEMRSQVEPAALKALPVDDNEENAPAPVATSPGAVGAATGKTKQVDFPVTIHKATRVD